MARFKVKKPEDYVKGVKWKKPLVDGLSVKTFFLFKKKYGVHRLLLVQHYAENHLIKKRWKKYIKAKNFLLGDTLLKEVKEDLQFIRHIANFTYLRHKFKLPARGQRSRTNARTQKKKTTR